MLREHRKKFRPQLISGELRCRRLVEQAISQFSLNLQDYVVLSENATGYYILTPMIAALAGAKKVYALSRDSVYGTAKEACNTAISLAHRWGVSDRVSILFSREDDRIGEADIVTNLGFVRPIDASFLRRLKSTAVIPLMWETWEYRNEDLDLRECRRLGIPVLGTDEHHPLLKTFEYIGHVALKLLFDLDIEVFGSKILVIGSGEFGKITSNTLNAAGAQVTLLNPQIWESTLHKFPRNILREADALVVVEHRDPKILIGTHGLIDAGDLYSLNPGLVIAHICGGIDRASIKKVGIGFYPNEIASPGYMSVTTEYLGPKPLIGLHAAGLKIGEELARARARGLTALQTELAVLRKTTLAQGFIGYHDIQDLREGND